MRQAIASAGKWLGALGTVNAVAVAYGRVVPFIATLAMFSIGRGIALLLNDKLPVSLLDLNGGNFGDPAVFSLLWFGNGRILGIPVSVYVFLAITIGAWVLLNRTRYGRYVVSVGGALRFPACRRAKVRRCAPQNDINDPLSQSPDSISTPGKQRC